MFISKNSNLLFFHVPKTAGTSLRHYLYHNCKDGNFFTNLTFELFIKKYNKDFQYSLIQQAFDNATYKHLTQNESMFILKQLNLNLDNFSEFVIVRNPYDRLLSYYNFVLYKSYDQIDKLLDDIEMNNVDPNLHFRYQLEYINNPITSNLKIFKYENLSECQEFLQKNIGVDKLIPKRNITKKSFVNELNPKLKLKVFRLFEEEFDRFEYSK